MLKNRKKEIEDIVDTLMTTTGLEFPKNSATDLAKILGIDYTLADLGDNRNAIIFWDEEFPKIVINDRGSASYQSFLLTKEIGHCVLGHVEKGTQYFLDKNTDYAEGENVFEREEEANYFAEYLLVPTPKLRHLLRQSAYGVRMSGADIAAFFGVPKSAIIRRADHLGYEII